MNHSVTVEPQAVVPRLAPGVRRNVCADSSSGSLRDAWSVSLTLPFSFVLGFACTPAQVRRASRGAASNRNA